MRCLVALITLLLQFACLRLYNCWWVVVLGLLIALYGLVVLLVCVLWWFAAIRVLGFDGLFALC